MAEFLYIFCELLFSFQQVDLNKVVIVKPTEKNWQECVDRNWAAEFGYGKEKPKQLGDILEKMKQKFFTAASSDDESSGEGGKTADEDMKSKKLQGRVKHCIFNLYQMFGFFCLTSSQLYM